MRKWLEDIRVFFSKFHFLLDIQYGLTVSKMHSFHIIQLVTILVSLIPNNHKQISLEDVLRPFVDFSLHAQSNSNAAADLL